MSEKETLGQNLGNLQENPGFAFGTPKSIAKNIRGSFIRSQSSEIHLGGSQVFQNLDSTTSILRAAKNPNTSPKSRKEYRFLFHSITGKRER